jgi:hypothetical protein
MKESRVPVGIRTHCGEGPPVFTVDDHVFCQICKKKSVKSNYDIDKFIISDDVKSEEYYSINGTVKSSL